MALFRREYIEGRRRNILGSVFIPPQRAALISSLVMSALIATAMAVASQVRYTRYDKFVGHITESVGRVVVSSPLGQGALVDDVYVKLGDSVVPGQPIALLTSDGDGALGAQPRSFNAFVYSLNPAQQSGGSLYVLTSSAGGYVDRIVMRGASGIAYGQPIVVLRNESRGVQLQVLVPSSSISEIKVGGKVRVQLDSVAEEARAVVPTTVRSISRSTLTPPEISGMFGLAPAGGPMYLVELDPSALTGSSVLKQVRPGMTFRVTVPAETKSLLQWIVGRRAPRNEP